MTEAVKEHDGYSIVREAYILLRTAALEHPQTTALLPTQAKAYAEKIKFTGNDSPSIPVNWRFAESVAVLKALEGIMINALLEKKYSVEAQDVVVNIDHAQLFIVSCLLTQIQAKGVEGGMVETQGFSTTSLFPSCDLHRNSATPYRASAGNLYKTKDDRYFHLHSDLNPNIIQDALSLPHDADGDFGEVHKIYEGKTTQYTANQLDALTNEKCRTSGTVAWTAEEYRSSAHGRANAETGLWSIEHKPNACQEPCWWPEIPNTSPARPLAGLKVVDFSRIIAAPTATRGLAEFGASVMRVTAPHLPDMGFLHPDMGWGKWNCSLDLREPEAVAKVKALIMDADVIVHGYRPQVLDKYGLAPQDVLELCGARKRGIVILQLNCYGHVGPWEGRSGWQQIR